MATGMFARVSLKATLAARVTSKRTERAWFICFWSRIRGGGELVCPPPPFLARLL
jgi:hypothetical protein